MTAPELSAEEKATVARFGVHDAPGGLPGVRVEPEAAPKYTNRYIRSMLRLRWRERDAHGVWFYGTWLLNRFYVIGIVGGVAGGLVGFWLTSILFGVLA
ncbi:MAG: hypothetical protein ACRDT9_00155 [Agromyces sp.]